MASRPHTLDLPNGETIRILTTDVSGGSCPFTVWPVSKQKEYIDLMQGHLNDLSADGSLEHLCVITETPMSQFAGSSPEKAAFYREDLIDGTCWKMANALRKTEPTRIAEAVNMLKFVIARQKRMNGGSLRESLPPLYLGVAYSYIPGKEDLAIEAFTEGFHVFENTFHGGMTLNELWARSHFARVLRQKGRVQEAKYHERRTREWIIGHLGFCAPSTFRKYIEGPWGTGQHIIDHGDVLEEFSQIEEIDPTQAIWHRNGSQLLFYGRTS